MRAEMTTSQSGMPTPPPMVMAAKTQIAGGGEMTEPEMLEAELRWERLYAATRFNLALLRAAYASQTGNYGMGEWDAIEAVWLFTFKDTPTDDLRDAVLMYVSEDARGFFPAPGQIMAMVKKVQANRRFKEYERLEREYQKRMDEQRQRVKNGEHCASCRFLTVRKESPIGPGGPKYGEGERLTAHCCENPDRGLLAVGGQRKPRRIDESDGKPDRQVCDGHSAKELLPQQPQNIIKLAQIANKREGGGKHEEIHGRADGPSPGRGHTGLA